MALTGCVDSAVKDYLLYRGLHLSLKVVDNELKNEKEKGFRVDRIMEMFHAYIATYDLAGLWDYWQFLDRRLFSRLEQTYAQSIRKLEVSLLKLYLVNVMQSNKPEKINEFFEKLTPEIQGQPEWRDWFVLPFIKNPEENATFAMYFTKQWQDTFFLSLHNFLSVIIQAMPAPAVLNCEETQQQITRLKLENDRYRQKLMQLIEQKVEGVSMCDLDVANTNSKVLPPAGSTSVDLMDDFFIISQDTTIQDKPQQAPKTGQIRSFIRNIGLPSSPILGKKTVANSSATASSSISTTAASASGSAAGPAAASSSSSSSSSPSSSTVASGKQHLTASPVASSSQYQQQQQQQSGSILRREPSGSKTRASDSQGRQRPRSSPITTSVAPPADQDLNISHADGNSSKEGMSVTGQDGDAATAAAAAVSQSECARLTSSMQDASDSMPPYLLMSQEEYAEHNSAITHCKFGNTGHMVASCDVDGVVKVWTLQPAPVTVATTMSRSALTAIEWASKTDRVLLLGSKSGAIRLYDVRDKKSVKEALVDTSYPRVVSLACSPSGGSFACSTSGKTLATGGATVESTGTRGGKLCTWDLKTMKIERELALSRSPAAVNWTTYNHNGQLLLTGAMDGNIRLFDLRKGDCISCWQGHHGEVYMVSFSTDETSCFSMGSDGKFAQWSINRIGRRLADLPIHQGACGPFVLTGAGGYRQVQTPKGKLFAFDMEGKHVLTCGAYGGVLYELEKDGAGSRKVLTLGGHKTPVVSVDWSAAMDCKMCLTGSMDGRVRVSSLLSQ